MATEFPGVTPDLVPFLVVFAALLALSALFSGSETAIFSLDRLQIRRFERSHSRRERLVAAMAAHPERLLAGILLGNTLVNVAGSSVALAITNRLEPRLVGGNPVTASVVLGTTLILLFGEVLPKGTAVHWAPRLAPYAALALDPVLRVFSPLARLLEIAARALLRASGMAAERQGSGLGPGELQVLFEDVQAGQEVSEDEGEMAANIFEFFETRAYEIMTPRVDLVALPVDISREELRRRVPEARHSRLPVYRDSLDQIIGFINAKEYLLDPDLPLDALLRPVHFVPERARLNRILGEIQARRLGLVVVVNEYGGTEGILTREDLAETVVGEIFDEQERDHALPMEPAGPRMWRVDGLYLLYDLIQETGVRWEPGPAETVAGHVAHLLGRPPRPGDAPVDGPFTFRVLAVRRHRAHRVLVTATAPVEGPR